MQNFLATYLALGLTAILTVTGLRWFHARRSALPDPVDARITHALRKAGDRLEQETQTPEHLYQAVVDYAFGSGDRGKTLVGRDPLGRMFELRIVASSRSVVVADGNRRPSALRRGPRGSTGGCRALRMMKRINKSGTFPQARDTVPIVAVPSA